MRHFDYYGTGYVSMNEVELALARALDLESHQNPTWDETSAETCEARCNDYKYMAFGCPQG